MSIYDELQKYIENLPISAMRVNLQAVYEDLDDPTRHVKLTMILFGHRGKNKTDQELINLQKKFTEMTYKLHGGREKLKFLFDWYKEESCHEIHEKIRDLVVEYCLENNRESDDDEQN